MSTARIGLCLEPLDVLFFRDGRPFAAATRATSGQPVPQTLAGAVWTALLTKFGCDFERLAEEVRRRPIREAVLAAGTPEWLVEVSVRGPWLARSSVTDGDGPDVLVPAPAMLHETKKKDAATAQGELHSLWPLETGMTLPGWRPPAPGLRPLWVRTTEATEIVYGYLDRAGQAAMLEGRVPPREHIVRADELFAYDHRTGIGVEPDRLTAEEGQIYAASFLALKPGACLYAEIVFPPGHADAATGLSTLHFGGEGRRVAVRPVAPFAWPDQKPAGNRKPFVWLTTPAHFQDGWRPRCLRNHLVAAAVPGDVAVSGWDLARGGPKPTRFGVAAGSVYFLDSMPSNLPDSLADSDEDRRQGWGCYLQGVWTDD
ncbi:MAG: type III-B CRISPR module-associated protein Cmr3 [Candidatus Anammoximicrobium sp.]|mgnify:CR=1 FL=1|nr:type III-B CRISPR module-associated protein Cmr3 [Candidatus Anammoximicrobium sp.]